ncbi:MAG: MFS transporter, partial [Mariprofundaceae bacterium]
MTNKRVVSWALYDWANSAFATTVMAGFFPLFFKQYWNSGADVTVSTFQLGVANSLASIIVASMAPILGAIADKGGTKKRFLLFFAMMGIVMSGALHFVAAGQWQLAIALYVAAFIGFAGSNIFYDALILDVSPENKLDMVSALGFSLGYLGGGILFAINVAMSLWPQFFGFADQAEAIRAAFITVAVWWALFSIPLLLFVREAPSRKMAARGNAIAAGFRQLRGTFRDIRQLKVVLLFLIAYWLYIDGVDTVIRMAVDYGMSLGLATSDLITALLITQFVGFPATLVFGRLGTRLGAKAALFIAIGVYIGVCAGAFFIRDEADFYMLAVVIGLV